MDALVNLTVPVLSLPQAHSQAIRDIVELVEKPEKENESSEEEEKSWISSRSFLTCSDDRTAKRWELDGINQSNTTDNRLSNTYSGHSKGVNCVVELDANLVATGSDDKTIKIWNKFGDSECIATLEVGKAVWSLLKIKVTTKVSVDCTIDIDSSSSSSSTPTSSTTSPSEPILFASGTSNGSIMVWKATKKSSSPIDHPISFLSSPTIPAVASVSSSSSSSYAFECIHRVKQHNSTVRCLYELSDGTIVSGSEDATLMLWELTFKSSSSTTSTSSSSSSSSISLEHVQTLEGHSTGVLRVLELKRRKANMAKGNSDSNLVFFASGSSDRSIKIWEKGRRRSRSREGEEAAEAASRGHGVCLRTLLGHTSTVYGLVELNRGINNTNNSDSTILLSVSSDLTLRAWDWRKGVSIATHKLDYMVYTIRLFMPPVIRTDQTYSAAAPTIVVGSHDGRIESFEVVHQMTR